MVSMEEVRAAVDNAKRIMTDCGVDVDVTADQLWAWFENDLPVPDVGLGDIVVDPILVIHELVEIDEILKMGLAITKDVIFRDPEKVDDAHLKATRVELAVAETLRASEHVKELTKCIEKWCVDRTLTDRRRAEYRRLLAEARESLARLS